MTDPTNPPRASGFSFGRRKAEDQPPRDSAPPQEQAPSDLPPWECLAQSSSQAGLTPDQELLKQIAALLAAVAPPAAAEIVAQAKLYESHLAADYRWVDAAGACHRFTRQTAPPLQRTQRLLELLEELRATPAFAPSPFNQLELRLRRAGGVELETADIPVEDAYLGLYMRPLSALSWEEAQALHIPRDAWEARQPGSSPSEG